jgi:hypothetical protein
MTLDLPKLAISTRQPWAHAIVQGWEQIENRTWSTFVRGPICIHASKFDKRNFNEDAGDYLATLAIVRASIEVPDVAFDDLAFGAIVGVADIVDCVTTSASPWFFGTYGFVLANARPITPIPLKGKQGFFDWRSRMDPEERPAEPAPAVQGLLL